MNQTQFIKAGNIIQYAILPYDEYKALLKFKEHKEVKKTDTIPHEVVIRTVTENESLITAWRKFLKVSQSELAQRMNTTQSAISQIEKSNTNQVATLEKIAHALKINIKQLYLD